MEVTKDSRFDRSRTVKDSINATTIHDTSNGRPSSRPGPMGRTSPWTKLLPLDTRSKADEEQIQAMLSIRPHERRILNNRQCITPTTGQATTYSLSKDRLNDVVALHNRQHLAPQAMGPRCPQEYLPRPQPSKSQTRR